VDGRKLAELLRTGMLRPVYRGENGRGASARWRAAVAGVKIMLQKQPFQIFQMLLKRMEIRGGRGFPIRPLALGANEPNWDRELFYPANHVAGKWLKNQLE
jgi:hypothetical protein